MLITAVQVIVLFHTEAYIIHYLSITVFLLLSIAWLIVGT